MNVQSSDVVYSRLEYTAVQVAAKGSRLCQADVKKLEAKFMGKDHILKKST